MKVFFIRHSEPDYSKVASPSYFGFARDFAPLTDRGIEIAKQCSANINLFKGAEILVSSPYTRALQTAAYLVQNRDIPFEVAVGLHEWRPDVTGLELGTAEQSKQAYKEFLEHDGKLFDGASFKYEEREHVKQRVSNVLDSYKERGFNSIAVVCHQVVIKQFIDIDTDIDFCQSFIYNY
ncbi:hypothetical protein BG261_02610 [Floricoccus tropicus]|uniref:Phosphoglycerate mutase n=1 Tax=Floricoccus tropicus TaxID=1859473 RepID=A0A1E8GML4_9LACT|nr:histidine phosphatase family protein [Floricoccus tropicus]OFI49489.1 hypothetical protein BG261_02610 [Floricoccus tropicus]